MRILKIEPEKAPVEAEITGTLDSMQEIVGGTIQVIYLFEDAAALLCNDEGKILGLPLNRALFLPGESQPYDITHPPCGGADCFTVLKPKAMQMNTTIPTIYADGFMDPAIRLPLPIPPPRASSPSWPWW